jgi:hypothetical protein
VGLHCCNPTTGKGTTGRCARRRPTQMPRSPPWNRPSVLYALLIAANLAARAVPAIVYRWKGYDRLAQVAATTQ